MVPSVRNTKTDGNLSVSAVTDRILVVIAPCEKGPLNTPSAFTSGSDCLDLYGSGMLTEAVAYAVDVAGLPVVAIRGQATTAGANGAVVATLMTGTSVQTLTGVPLDDYGIRVQYLTGGVKGTAGIVYRYALDGFNAQPSWSLPQQLGAAPSFLIPGSGVTVNLGAGTVVTGDEFSATCTGPLMTNTDIGLALAALQNYDSDWLRCVVLGTIADSTVLATLNLEAVAYHAFGKWPEFIAPLRPRVLGPSEELRATYLAALAAVVAPVQSLEVVACADQCEMVSTVTKRRIRRPSALPIAVRLISVANDSVSGAAKALGALPGVFISDSTGTIKYHDEARFPGLDDLQITCLRSWRSRPRTKGAFINLVKVLSGPSSDYNSFQVTAMHNRIIETAGQLLEQKLGSGLLLNPNGTIREDIAKSIEEDISSQLRTLYSDPGMVSGVKLVLNRNDNVLTTGSIGYWCPIQPLGYVTSFVGKSGLVRAFAA